MTDANSTAKVTKIVASSTQTENPKFKGPETQTAKVYTGTKWVPTPAPLTYDLAAQDDNSEQLANDIEMVSQYQSEQEKKERLILSIS